MHIHIGTYRSFFSFSGLVAILAPVAPAPRRSHLCKYVQLDGYTKGLYTKGTRSHTHRELIRYTYRYTYTIILMIYSSGLAASLAPDARAPPYSLLRENASFALLTPMDGFYSDAHIDIHINICICISICASI